MNNLSNPFEEIDKKLIHLTNLVMEMKESTPRQSPVNSDIRPKLVKIDEAVKITGYRKTYIYEMVLKKQIPFIRRGRSIRFDTDELDAWMRAGRPNIFKQTIKMMKDRQ